MHARLAFLCPLGIKNTRLEAWWGHSRRIARSGIRGIVGLTRELVEKGWTLPFSVRRTEKPTKLYLVGGYSRRNHRGRFLLCSKKDCAEWNFLEFRF
ncbi:hypothetical protein SAMN03080599_01283 [Acidaminobacter hydrogenoformans DSM 2784]|uniref:Uncharacterized protein n=1 Tax=Acidaminobacter hydrogenoformans DSM 2784 TaxID=1120920 RepID=A0A1G5RZ15_9FIRM|nr:hypothetical protein SAMN03080599_01283 [Acidaminobacter hydrogenoformans DSM 2784]